MDPYQLVVQAPDASYAASADQNHHHRQTNRSRRSANYHPTVWGEHFLGYASNYNVKGSFGKEIQEHERLKEEMRKMLIDHHEAPDKSRQKLDLIDNIQRLGVAYHFETEIEASMPSILEQFQLQDDGDDLYVVSLRFRLLRQLGHYVSCDVFYKFKDQEGNFKESLVSNVPGLLSFYEAANFLVHDEDILEEALNFTTSQLKSKLPSINNFWASRIRQALEMPIQKTLNRPGSRQYISLYQEDRSHDAVLLKFAKLDFNILQRQHQKELGDITKWWKGLDCPNKLPFVRDRLVECFFWILGVYFEPKYSSARTTMTKVIALTSILDDIYDVYGIFDELVLLTDSIERWDASALDQLPPYMRHCYQNLLNVYSEMEEKLAKYGKSNLVKYAISSMKGLVRVYLEEAKWFHNKHVPNFEEYVKVAIVGCGYGMLATNALVCMGKFTNEDAVDWLAKNPLIVRAASVISRLMDDIATHEMEKERGEVAKAIECYKKQYGTTKEAAIVEFQKQITDAWKDINKECLVDPTSTPGVPMFVLERILNFARVMYLLYKDGNSGYTNSSTTTKHLITVILVDPVPI